MLPKKTTFKTGTQLDLPHGCGCTISDSGFEQWFSTILYLTASILISMDMQINMGEIQDD